MKIRHANSHIKKNCVVCNLSTASSKIYEEGGISIRVPVCDRDLKDCHAKVIVKELCKTMLRKIKMEVSA